MAYRFNSPHPGPPRRVVVTGTGIITAHGCGWEKNAHAFRTGLSSLRPVTLFDVSRQRVTTAGEVQLPPLPPLPLSAQELRRIDRATHLLLHAGHELLTTSGFSPEKFHEKSPGPSTAGYSTGSTAEIPCVLGTSAGGMALGEAFHRQASASPPTSRHQPTRALYYQATRQAAVLQQALRLPGPLTLISNACASGANAIAHAFSLVRNHRAPAALCGGYDALSHLVFAGFDTLKALSPTTPRPFDARRDGLAIGEGAGLLLLEDLDHALARNAPILAEITGSGSATDLHHLTQPHPQGDAALASMTAACAMAGLRPDEIDYLNSHGTGTPLNDIAEALAIQRWAGPATARLPVSSTKAGIGHLLGGAGAVEAIVCLMALKEQFLPPGLNIETPDPACTFDLVRTPRAARLRAALTNSFGFGGSNATLIFQLPQELRA